VVIEAASGAGDPGLHLWQKKKQRNFSKSWGEKIVHNVMLLLKIDLVTVGYVHRLSTNEGRVKNNIFQSIIYYFSLKINTKQSLIRTY
jgi:hypothetical protein